MYSYDTLQENSSFLVLNRNRLPADGNAVSEGLYEQVVCFLRFGAVSTD